MVPKARKTHRLVTEVSDEVAVFDQLFDRAHRLNPSAEKEPGQELPEDKPREETKEEERSAKGFRPLHPTYPLPSVQGQDGRRNTSGTRASSS